MLLPTTLLLALLALTFPIPTRSTPILCAGNLYGNPDLPDAITLSDNLPYVKVDTDGDMDAVRIFAEPAFFTPRFRSLTNTFQTAMVQLPRVWRYRSARMALLFYANAAGYVPNASTNGNWRAVQAAAAGVLHYCVRGQRGVGGVWILSDDAQMPLLALYLYASGSPFEDVLNRYMITGRGVNPFDPRGFGIEGGVRVNSSVVVVDARVGGVEGTG